MRQKPALLFLAHLLPWPLDGGGQIKSYHTLRLLAREYDVTLLAFIRRPEETQDIEPLRVLCRDIRTVLIPRSRARNIASAASALLSGRSFLIGRDSVPAMHAALAQALAEREYAAIHVDHLQMAQYIPDGPTPPVVLDQHNIEHRIPQRMAQTAGANPLMRAYAAQEWPKLRRFEIAACRRADHVLTVSDEDRAGLAALAPDVNDRISVVPIGVDLDYFSSVRRRSGSHTLLSIGTMYWPPNVDSMLYFCGEILPIIRKSIPDVHLNIVGAKPVPAICALAEADPSVTVTGLVPDVRDWAVDCGAFVTPLRSGSGMRVKILNAMAMGLPVVSTSVGAEGIDVQNGYNILLADGTSQFADATIRVIQDISLAQRIADGGRRLMQEHYSWDSVGERLLGVYADLLARSAGQAPQ